MPSPIQGSTTQIVPSANASVNAALSALATASPRVMIVNHGPSVVYVRFSNVAAPAATVADVPVAATASSATFIDKPIGWGYAAVFMATGGTTAVVDLTGAEGR